MCKRSLTQLSRSGIIRVPFTLIYLSMICPMLQSGRKQNWSEIEIEIRIILDPAAKQGILV